MTTTINEFVDAAPGRPSRSRSGPKATWRFATRLARREVRRRPGRTLLVMLLIAIPVCGMTMITVVVRTNTDSVAETFARHFGAADLVASTGPLIDGRVRIGSSNDVASLPPVDILPSGARVLRAHRSTSPIGLAAANGTARLADATDLDLNDPITHGIVQLRAGRFPQRAGEAIISPELARAFGVGVGDTLRLTTPAWSEKIVGIGQRATNWNDNFIAVRGTELTTRAASARGATITDVFVDLPGRPTASETQRYEDAGYTTPLSSSSRTPNRAVDWVLVGGIVALAIVGIVISGAFAVGARRQLVTLGQLSANGADEQLLRRTLSLQGLISGAIGSFVGLAVGIVVLLFLHGRLAQLIHHDPGPYVWSARDTIAVVVIGVVTATVAAFIPARSAARVPVLSALAGRRPLGNLPKRLVPIGAALFASGLFVLVLVATASGSNHSDGLALSAVFGGLLVLSGACCASSMVVAGLATFAHRARGAARVAIRSVVRSRARSAAVVMALAAINAGAIAIGTAIDSHTGAKSHDINFMPDDTLIVSSGGDLSGNVRQFLPPSAAVTSTLRRILPDAQVSTRRAVVGNGSGIPLKLIGPEGGIATKTRTPGGGLTLEPPIATVTDPAVLQMLGLSARDTAAFEHAGIIAMQAPTDRNGKLPHTIPVVLGTTRTTTVDAPVAQDDVRATGDSGGVFISEAKARALHLPIVDAGILLRNPTPLNESQRASIDVLVQSLFFEQARTTSTNIAWSGTSDNAITEAQARQIVLGIVVFIALIVLAMSLALSAAETRDERDVLVSLGARPSTMRSVSAWKAAVLAASGALVAVPTGFIPVAVVFMAIAKPGETVHVAFPWSTTLQLLVLAPLIAALVAYIGSAIAQAVRPTRMSTFATD